MMIKIPNLGLCSIASNLDKNYCDVKVLDLTIAGRNPEKYFCKTIKYLKPDVVGFSCMAFQYKSSVGLAKMTKELFPASIVVFGGYYSTIDSDTILNSDDMNYIDYIVRGEGEICFNELIKGLVDNSDLSGIKGLCYRSDGKLINNRNDCLIELEKLKLPDRSARLLYKGFNIMGKRSDAIETSRGCVYDCNFCSINMMYGKSYRKYSFERVLEDIRDAKKYGAKTIMMTDDNITLDGKRYKELCETITDAKLNDIRYLLQASVDGIKRTPGLPKAMADSGVKWVFLGIENINDNSLSLMNKNEQMNKSDAYDVIGELRSFGIVIIGGFVLGYPDDTEEVLRANYEFAKKIEIDLPTFNIVTPYPNTPIRKELLEEGLITNLNDYTKYDCWEVNVKTRYLTTQQIYDIRDDMEAKYPIQSGSFWRIWKKFPFYSLRLFPRWAFTKPHDLFRIFRGFQKSF